MMLLHQLYPNVQLAGLSFDHKEPFAKMRQLEVKKFLFRRKVIREIVNVLTANLSD
jgi:hypothetical protein